MSTTIRISEATRDRFVRLARSTGRPMTQLLDEAADALERQLFFEAVDASYEALRQDAYRWAQVKAERAEEEAALTDESP